MLRELPDACQLVECKPTEEGRDAKETYFIFKEEPMKEIVAALNKDEVELESRFCSLEAIQRTIKSV